MNKRLKIEGSPASKMVQLIRKHGYNKDIGIEVGLITSPLPDVKIKLNDGIELYHDDLILSQTVYDTQLNVDDKVIIISDNDTQYYFVIDKVVM